MLVSGNKMVNIYLATNKTFGVITNKELYSNDWLLGVLDEHLLVYIKNTNTNDLIIKDISVCSNVRCKVSNVDGLDLSSDDYIGDVLFTDSKITNLVSILQPNQTLPILIRIEDSTSEKILNTINIEVSYV